MAKLSIQWEELTRGVWVSLLLPYDRIETEDARDETLAEINERLAVALDAIAEVDLAIRAMREVDGCGWPDLGLPRPCSPQVEAGRPSRPSRGSTGRVR